MLRSHTKHSRWMIYIFMTAVVIPLTACTSSTPTPNPPTPNPPTSAPAGGEPINVVPLAGFREDVMAIRFTPDGKLLAGVYLDSVYRWNLADAQLEQTFASEQNYFAFSPDGTIAATAPLNSNPPITIWDTASGKELRSWIAKPLQLPADENFYETYQLDISPNNKDVLATYDAGVLQAWDYTTGQASLTLGSVSDGFSSRIAKFSPNGQWIGVVGYGGTLKIWDIASNKEIQSFAEPSLKYHGADLVWSNDSRWLALSSNDKTGGSVVVWNTTTWTVYANFAKPADLYAVGFSPDGQILGIGSANGEIYLYDLASKAIQTTLKGHNDRVRTLEWNADGTLLASGGKEGFILIWDTATMAQKQRLDLPPVKQ